jgi:hypothetical protein
LFIGKEFVGQLFCRNEEPSNLDIVDGEDELAGHREVAVVDHQRQSIDLKIFNYRKKYIKI